MKSRKTAMGVSSAVLPLHGFGTIWGEGCVPNRCGCWIGQLGFVPGENPINTDTERCHLVTSWQKADRIGKHLDRPACRDLSKPLAWGRGGVRVHSFANLNMAY